MTISRYSLDSSLLMPFQHKMVNLKRPLRPKALAGHVVVPEKRAAPPKRTSIIQACHACRSSKAKVRDTSLPRSFLTLDSAVDNVQNVLDAKPRTSAAVTEGQMASQSKKL